MMLIVHTLDPSASTATVPVRVKQQMGALSISLWNLPSLQAARSITANTYVNTEPPPPSTTAGPQ